MCYVLLCAIPVIPLDEHYLLSHVKPLFGCTETEYTAQSWVGLFVSVGHTHPSTCRDIESFQIAILPYNSDKPNIIGKHINIIRRWYRYCYFELQRKMSKGTEKSRRHTDLSWKVILAVERFMIMHSTTSNEFLV